MGENQLFDDLRNGKNSAFEEAYKLGFPLIYKLVTTNNGTKRDAQDLMQDTLFALVKNLRKPDFKLTCKVSTYLYSIARNLWLMKLRSSGKELLNVDDEDQQYIMIEDNEIEQKQVQEEKYQIIADVLKEMGEKCRNIIMEFYYKKTPLAQIAESIGMTPQSMKVTKHRCMKDFKSKVAANKNYVNV